MMSQRAEIQKAHTFLKMGGAKEVNGANSDRTETAFNSGGVGFLHDSGPLKLIPVVSRPSPGYANEQLQCWSSEDPRCMMQLLVKSLNVTPCSPSNLRADYLSLQLALQRTDGVQV